MSAMSEIAITLETDWVQEDARFTWYRHRSGRWEITASQQHGLILWRLCPWHGWRQHLVGSELHTLVYLVDQWRDELLAPFPVMIEEQPWWRRLLDRLGL